MRVAYVDIEPVAAAASAELLAEVDTATITRADLRDPAAVLAAPGVVGLLDFTRPVALLAVAVLHYVSDGDDPAAVLARYRQAMAPGSVLAITHSSLEAAPHLAAAGGEAAAAFTRRSGTPVYPRSPAQITVLLSGFDLVEPGLVNVIDWRPDETANPTGPPLDLVAAVGHRHSF